MGTVFRFQNWNRVISRLLSGSSRCVFQPKIIRGLEGVLNPTQENSYERCLSQHDPAWGLKTSRSDFQGMSSTLRSAASVSQLLAHTSPWGS